MTVPVFQLPATRKLLNITASTLVDSPNAPTVGPTAPLHLVSVIVNTPGSTTTTINDCASTGAASASNTVLSIPATAVTGTVYLLNAPITSGLVVVPGTSAVIAVLYNS